VLSIRIIAVLTLRGNLLSRTKRFRPDYRYTKSQITLTEVDELVMLNIERSDDFLEGMREVEENYFGPLTLGGGIRSYQDARAYMLAGADKVAVNTGAFENNELIPELAYKLGSQSVCLSIDAKDDEVFTDCGKKATGVSPVEWAKTGVEMGAGEILITSIDRDGSLRGYDLDLCKSVADAVPVPVIFHGGAGNWRHFHEGLQNNASAVATQNIYHFTTESMIAAKTYLKERGYPVRL